MTVPTSVVTKVLERNVVAGGHVELLRILAVLYAILQVQCCLKVLSPLEYES